MNKSLKNSEVSADASEGKLRLSVLCVFLSDTVNLSRYKLSDGEVKNILFENDSPIYPPYGINLKICGQNVLLKNIFGYILKNADTENCSTTDFFLNIITPAWGAWETDEAIKNTVNAAGEAIRESNLNPGFRWTIKVRSGMEIMHEKYSSDVIAQLTDGAFGFYPPENSGLLKFSMKSDMKVLVSAVQYYTGEKLAVRIIYDEQNIRNAVAQSKKSDDVINMHSVSETDSFFYDYCRRENEQDYFESIKNNLAESFSDLARECEKSFTSKLVETPEGWDNGTNTSQSFFTVFFDSIYKPALWATLDSQIIISVFKGEKITDHIKAKAKAEAEVPENKLTEIINSAAERVYSRDVIKKAAGFLDSAVVVKADEAEAGTDMTEVLDCEKVRTVLSDKLKNLFSDIVRLEGAPTFKFGKNDNRTISRKEIDSWIINGHEDTARIYDDIKKFIISKYTGTADIFAEVLTDEYRKMFAGGVQGES